MTGKTSSQYSASTGVISAAYFETALLHPPTKQVMSCSGAYEKHLKRKVIRLEDCAEGLRKSVVELRNASSDAKFWNNAIAASRIVAIGCDCILATVSSKAVNIKNMLKVVDVGYSSGKALSKAVVGQASKADALMLLAENKAKVADLILEMKGLDNLAHVGKALAYLQGAKDFHDAIMDWRGGSDGLESQVLGTVAHIQKLERDLAGVKLELQNCGFAV